MFFYIQLAMYRSLYYNSNAQCSSFCNKIMLPTVLNALFFKYVNIYIEDHELLVVVVNTSTISNITITVECFFSKSILPIVVLNIQEIH